MNSIQLIGRLTAEPELKTSKGYKYCQFSLAVDRPMSKEKTVDFFNCTAFGKTAEIIIEYCKKGRQLGVNGILQTNKKDNVTYYSIGVNTVTLIGSRDDSDSSSKPKRASKNIEDNDFYDDEPKKTTNAKEPKPMEDDDEYPF